jgi:hypothetical protein
MIICEWLGADCGIINVFNFLNNTFIYHRVEVICYGRDVRMEAVNGSAVSLLFSEIPE